MSDGVILPLIVTGGVEPQVNASLAEATQRLTAAEGAVRSMSNAWTETKAKLDLAAAAFNRVVGFADQISALTAEQQQLTAASERLSLDFNAAADGAGRFVDETEAMAAASRLAEAGLHLTQEELNQLTARAAIASQRLGVDTTTAFNMLTTAIESGSARALRPFGEDMVALAGSTHSAEERLGAFVTTTHGMARATDDASTSMQRLRDSVGDAEREMAASFSAELARLATISTEADRAGAHIDDAQDKMRAAGQTAALVLAGIANAMGAVLGTFAVGVQTIVGGVRVAVADINALAHFRDPRAAHAAAMAESFGNDSSAMAAARFVQDRINALGALAGDTGAANAGTGAVRSAIGAPAPSTVGDMVFGESQADADEAYRAAHRRQSAGGGRRPARPTIDQLMSRAGAAERYQVSGEIRLDDSASEAERNAASKAEAQRSADEGAYAAERQQETDRRSRDATRRAHEQERDIGVGMRESLTRYGDTARHTRDLVVGAFDDMTEAVGKHIEAVVKGRESLKDAGLGVLSDFLSAVSKRASVSAAEEGVAALASVAVGDLRGAALHGAAAVGYTAVAALAGAASTAVAPTAPATGAPARAPERAALPSAGGKSAGEGQVVNVYFGGPVIGPGGSRQAARDIAAILNDGARQGGVRLTPNLLPVMP